MTIVQGGEENLSLAVVDEFYIFDLMELRVDIDFKFFLFFWNCILLITKVKLFQET